MPHDFGIAVLEDMVTSYLDLTITRLRAKSRLAPEVDELSSEVSLVLRNVLVQRRWKTRVIPSCCLKAIDKNVANHFEGLITFVSEKSVSAANITIGALLTMIYEIHSRS